MSDIFISYTREDQAWAQRLAGALEAQDWSVWCDRSIPPGTPYDATIEEQLRTARCVVVLWSRRSVESHRVRAEATEGLERKILVPVLIEETELPLAFRQIQCVQLAGWKVDHAHPGLHRLVEATGGLNASCVAG